MLKQLANTLQTDTDMVSMILSRNGGQYRLTVQPGNNSQGVMLTGSIEELEQACASADFGVYLDSRQLADEALRAASSVNSKKAMQTASASKSKTAAGASKIGATAGRTAGPTATEADPNSDDDSETEDNNTTAQAASAPVVPVQPAAPSLESLFD